MSGLFPAITAAEEAHITRVREEARAVLAVGYSDFPGRGPLLYWAINRIDLRVYVGATVQRFRERVGRHQSDARWGKGKTRFSLAMRAVGVENFEFVAIEYFASEAEMNAEEKADVARLGTTDPRIGYNSVGGGGCVGSAAGIKAAATRRARLASLV
jgi:hypothetical protein